ERVEGRAHVAEPAVSRLRIHFEGDVPHPQSGMTSLLTVGRRPAPVLFQEHPQPVAGALRGPFRVHRLQNRILGDAIVESVDERDESVMTAHLVVECLAHAVPVLAGAQHDTPAHRLAFPSSAAMRGSSAPSMMTRSSGGTRMPTSSSAFL